MAIVYSYPTVPPESQDLLIGVEMAVQGGEGTPRTKTFTIGSIVELANGGVVGPEGPQGPIGPQGVQGNTGTPGAVGPAGLNWQGAWVSETSYVEDDAVGWDGASWFCILATSGTTVPSLATANWALLASQGAQGLTGAQGPTGAQGISGAGTLQQTIDNGNTVTDSFSGDTTMIFGGGVIVTNAFGNTAINPYQLQFKNGSYYSYLEHPGTFTADRTYTLPNASGTVALTSDITGAQVTKVLKTTITNAQVLQLYTTPITVLPAASSGKINMPTNIYIKRNAGTAYTLYNSLALLDNLNIDTNTQINPNPLSNTTVGFMNNSIYLSESASGNTTNAPYKLKVLDGNPTGGTGNLDVYVTYIEITL